MPKNPELEPYKLNIRRGDLDFLTSVCRPRGIQVSHVIRTLISKKVDELRETLPPTKLPEELEISIVGGSLDE